jgi:hypothetical protein
MAKRKVKILKESKVSDAYEAVTGFNYPDGDKEGRVEAGAFLFEKDFTPETWKSMHANKVLKQIVEPETDTDSIAAEVIS